MAPRFPASVFLGVQMSDPNLGNAPPPLSNLQRKIRINFGLFIIFFVLGLRKLKRI